MGFSIGIDEEEAIFSGPAWPGAGTRELVERGMIV